MIAPAILSSVLRLLQRRAEPGRGHARARRRRREREAEDDRGQQDLRHAALARLHLGERDARDGRQVAGHERQHAGRDERDEADREGGDDGGVDAAAHRPSSASRRRASSALSSGGELGLDRLVARVGAPALEGDADPDRGQQHEHDRDDPQRRVEAVRPGLGEHLLAVLVDERGLDLRLVLARGDLLADERALLERDRRAGDAEHGAALDAHHLVLDVRAARPRRLGAPRERHGRQEGASRIHVTSSCLLRQQLRQVLVEPRLRDREAPQRRDAAAAVDQERLRIARTRRTRARTRGRGRAGSGTSPCSPRGRRSPCRCASCVSMPRTIPPWDSIFSCVFCSSGTSSRHGSHQEAQTFSTTTLPL